MVICALYLILLIPESAPDLPAGENQPFSWNQDEYWDRLEAAFTRARLIGCETLDDQISAGLNDMDILINRAATDTVWVGSPLLVQIERNLFELSTLAAACPERSPEYIQAFGTLRTHLKRQSTGWDMTSRDARDRIYRLLYGGRTAIEEVMLQSREELVPQTVFGVDEPSAAQSVTIHGVKIHSGDILISRGGAPTSALIARGQDYPGNFSHAALVHIDESSEQVSIIESHIECGVAVATIDEYLADTKLRIMVLRLRSDLPCTQSDPLLAHKAAVYALARARANHIPYDFAMDMSDASKLFCSEVVSDAYRHVGVQLWTVLSHISSPGVKSWLAAFGVENHTTQEPSDLEYDPQVQVVAEWRDYKTLLKDRLDNAVVDIMLEGADNGDELEYDWYLLPIARVLKAYSSVLNQFGSVGPIPEGMSAAAALRNEWFSTRHRHTKELLQEAVEQFRRDNGYNPPYWELIDLAREAYSKI